MEATPSQSGKSPTVVKQSSTVNSGLTPAAASLLSTTDPRVEAVGLAAPVILDTSLSGVCVCACMHVCLYHTESLLCNYCSSRSESK